MRSAGARDSILVEWFGHSYVRLTYPNGFKLVIDPHDGGSLNLPEFRVEADALLITHDHYDHNAIEVVDTPKGAVYKSYRGRVNIGPVEVVGYRSFHDKSQGSIRGENTVYIIEGPLRVAHLGDLGHKPGLELLEALQDIDLLMIPVGGVYTIDAYEAWEIVETVRPRLVLPIHFWIPRSTVPLDPLEVCLNVSKARRLRIEGNSVKVAKTSLPEKTTVLVMQLPYG